MSMQKKEKFNTICMITGCVLIGGAIIIFLWWQISGYIYAGRIIDYVDRLYDLMPESRAEVLEERSDNTMPVISIDGEDFIGVIEFAEQDAVFPVCAKWGKSDQFPCRYSGSVYDSSIVIGCTNQHGQLDFVKELSVLDIVTVTDMTGSCYSYRIADIVYRDNADNEILFSKEEDLTLFVKNIYAFEYIIIRCSAIS